MKIALRGGGDSRKIRIDAHFELSSMCFNELSKLWGERPKTTNDFFMLFTNSCQAELANKRFVGSNLGKINNWAISYKTREEAVRTQEVFKKKEHSLDVVEGRIIVANKEEYFVRTMAAMLSNPTINLANLCIPKLIKDAEHISSQCVERGHMLMSTVD